MADKKLRVGGKTMFEISHPWITGFFKWGSVVLIVGGLLLVLYRGMVG